MSISRRGLIAAGLALATAGTIGVASTLNAGAAQIEPPPVVATTTEPAPTAVTPPTTRPAATEPAGSRTRTKARRTPPSTLPWGAKPRTVRKAGTTGLSVDGASASSAEIPEPVPAYEPKGRPGVGGANNGLVTRGVSAAGAGVTVQAVATTAPAVPAVNFFYSSADQIVASDGAYATLTISRPWLSKRDYHSLGEIAVRSLDGRQIVEVGWTVDRDVNNGSAEPHLFVYHWVDRKESCYNGCGFVQYSQKTKPGDPLPVGEAKQFAIQHFGTAWWIGYDNDWIGYFPDDLWKGTYTRGGLAQWFGEVAASSLAPCTDMGNNRPATAEEAATFQGMTLIKAPTPVQVAVNVSSPLYSGLWPEEQETPTFRFGGKGAC